MRGFKLLIPGNIIHGNKLRQVMGWEDGYVINVTSNWNVFSLYIKGGSFPIVHIIFMSFFHHYKTEHSVFTHRNLALQNGGSSQQTDYLRHAPLIRVHSFVNSDFSWDHLVFGACSTPDYFWGVLSGKILQGKVWWFSYRVQLAVPSGTNV